MSKNIIENLYRKNYKLKINKHFSKIPLRNYIRKIKLDFVLKTKKIGFSAATENKYGKFHNYSIFQNIVLKAFKKEHLK